MLTNKVLIGDAKLRLQEIQTESVQMCVTSPPYFGLRQYFTPKIQLKYDAPQWVKDKLEELNIKPIN